MFIEIYPLDQILLYTIVVLHARYHILVNGMLDQGGEKAVKTS